MAIVELDELARALGPEKRVLGLDLGSKCTGVALSDVSRTIASPLETIEKTKFSEVAKRIGEIIAEFDVGAIVIGLPVSMDGSEGPRCQSARTFAANLLQKTETEICFWDERLSTSAVERMLVNDVDMTRRRRKQVIDKLAATYILQGALDSMARAGNTP